MAAELRPVRSKLARDEIFFEAGRASARPRTRRMATILTSVAGLSVAANVLLVVLLIPAENPARSQTSIEQNDVARLGARSPADESLKSTTAEERLSPRSDRRSTFSTSADVDYLTLRDQMLRGDWQSVASTIESTSGQIYRPANAVRANSSIFEELGL